MICTCIYTPLFLVNQYRFSEMVWNLKLEILPLEICLLTIILLYLSFCHVCVWVCVTERNTFTSFTLFFEFGILTFPLFCSFLLQTNEVTNRIQCHRSRWWTRHRAAASVSWRRLTLPTSSSRMLGRVSCPRHPWSVTTP